MENHLDEIYEAYDDLEKAKKKKDRAEVKRLQELIEKLRRDIVLRATGKIK